MDKRYYYKCGNSLLNLKSPVDNPDYTEITEQEFNELSKPKEVSTAIKNLRKNIADTETKIKELKEDLLDVMLLGKKDDSSETKRQECIELKTLLKRLKTDLEIEIEKEKISR